MSSSSSSSTECKFRLCSCSEYNCDGNCEDEDATIPEEFERTPKKAKTQDADADATREIKWTENESNAEERIIDLVSTLFDIFAPIVLIAEDADAEEPRYIGTRFGLHWRGLTPEEREAVWDAVRDFVRDMGGHEMSNCQTLTQVARGRALAEFLDCHEHTMTLHFVNQVLPYCFELEFQELARSED